MGEEAKDPEPKTAPSRGVSLVDLILRIVAIISTFASSLAMATTNQRLPFLARFIRFRTQLVDLPTFTFYVAANTTTCGYLLVSLALSILHVVKSEAKVTRIAAIFLDAAMMGLLTAASSAAAAVVYLAQRANGNGYWFSNICQRYDTLCERVSGCLGGSFIGVILLLLMVVLSGIALSKN